MLRKRLEDLESTIMLMFEKVEELYNLAFSEKFSENTVKIAKEIETTIDDYELKIEAECIQFIALYQPEASNLRTVMMLLKINNDLERIGDLAYKIFKSMNYIHNHNLGEFNGDVELMRKTTYEMFQNVIKSLVNRDIELAKQIMEDDDKVDDLQKKIFKDIKAVITEDDESEVLCFNKNRIVNAIERIADLITNIAEDIVYIKTGKIIKHED